MNMMMMMTIGFYYSLLCIDLPNAFNHLTHTPMGNYSRFIPKLMCMVRSVEITGSFNGERIEI